jgi:DNA-binding transcriptional LysR family regulator
METYMDRFEAMSVVLAVAEAGSLSEAARRKKTPLATVSRKVSELEAHLETKLFNRSSRALVLAEAERAASGEYTTPRGELHVSAPVGLGRILLVPALRDFLAAFPEVDIQLGLHDRFVNLLEEHIDVTLRVGTLADSSLIAIHLGDVRRVTCASPAYLKARGTPLSPEDIKGHDCISYAPLGPPGSWTFTHDRTERAVPVQSRLVVSNVDAACDAARAGTGIAMAFTYHVAASVKAGTLVTLLDGYQPPPVPVNFVYSPSRFMPVKLRAFLDFLAPRLKKELAAMHQGRGAK